MTPDPELASSSEQKSEGHNLSCESRGEHEVFLSHSGKQKIFVYGLFDDFLNHERFRLHKPFFDVDDESLRKGEIWIPKLIKAARECKVAVLVLTDDFLTSKWPMLELLHFVDARETTNKSIILLPVFFGDMVPAYLSDADCLARWTEKWKKLEAADKSAEPRQVSLTVKSCLEAVQKLKKINGIKNADFLTYKSLQQDILSKVEVYLPSGYEKDPDVAGYDRLCKIISGMFHKNHEGVYRLGLFGMGGSGKTTICDALCTYFGASFNQKVYHLKMGSYNRNSLTSYKDVLESRQEDLLKKLFRLSKDEIDRNPGNKFKNTLKEHFRRQPVFLAIDDIRDEDPESCEEARTYMSYLSPGSKIILTARSPHILKNICNTIHCQLIPNLNEEEALCLFLRFAVPERKLTSLNKDEVNILRSCLHISFFPLEEAGGSADSDDHVQKEVCHYYHPLALRAIAFYFNKQNSKLDNIESCGLELISKQKQVFSSNISDSMIFGVLGIGFQDLDPMTKQLFIDVALYAPRQVDGEGIFNWLLDINQFNGVDICRKLQNLREMSFLNFEDSESACPTCVNISLHDLYREYAKKLVNKHDNEFSYKYGVYNDDYDHAPQALAYSGWPMTPRIRLWEWKDAINETEWRSVSVIHLVRCETITIFSIGSELKNLRELKIRGCSKLEQLQWTPGVVSEQRQGEFKLCFVELRDNESLKRIPDFSYCSQLRQFIVTECSTSVEPISLHAWSDLRVLSITGDNAPEVRNLQSCLKLKSVHLVWKASHSGLVVGNLPSLLYLKIAGAAVLPKMHRAHEQMVPHGSSLFRQQYPDETVRYKLTGISQLTNLRYLDLSYIALGRLPEGLNKLGSSLENLHLRGCLLSEVVDFSDFSSLQDVSIAQTNVREIRGMSGLKKLERLDCRFNFRLQTIPDLRPAVRLQNVLLDQCPDLTAIPRLPARYFGASTEDNHRMVLAVQAFAKTTKSVIQPPRFALETTKFFIQPPRFALETTKSFIQPALLAQINTSMTKIILDRLTLTMSDCSWKRHLGVQCDGCSMVPLSGPRYKLKDIRTTFDLCRKCFSNKTHRCHCNFDSENSSPRRLHCEGVLVVSYDLCQICFVESKCNESDFYYILQTIN